MLTRICLILALLGATPLWSQVAPSASGGTTNPDDDSRMNMPPPVGGESSPMTGTAEERSNFLSGGLTFITAYQDNVFAGGTSGPVGDETYSILPTISLDQRTPRQHRTLSYSSGFVFYHPTSDLNSVQQNASLGYVYRFSPRTTLSVRDSFLQSTNAFNQSASLSGAAKSGPEGLPTVAVIAPFANQLGNSADVVISYQFGEDGMVGGSGSTALLDYPNRSQVPDLYNYTSAGGSGFYSRRLTSSQYIGAIYKYSESATTPFDSTTETHTISLFYTLYVNRNLTFSFSGGPQYYNSTETGAVSTHSWDPAGTASVEWRGLHYNLNAKYSRSIYGGGGLLGTFETNDAALSWNWQMKRTWSLNTSGIYLNSKNVAPVQAFSSPGGHTVSESASIQHRMGERLSAEAGYSRLDQQYSGIGFVSTTPSSDRVYVSVSYQLSRPLGR